METSNSYLVPGTAEIRASLAEMRREHEVWEEEWRSQQKNQPTLADLLAILQQLVADIAVLKTAAINDPSL